MLHRVRHFHTLLNLDEKVVPYRIEMAPVMEDLASFSALDFTEPPIVNGKYVHANANATGHADALANDQPK
jgi:hypothetical protein